MVKKKEVFVASDGKEFNTEKAAMNYEHKQQVNKVKTKFNMSTQEIQEALLNLSATNKNIKEILIEENHASWITWSTKNVRKILKEKIYKVEKKTTLYVKKSNSILRSEEEIGKQVGLEFTDPELFCGDEYKVIEIKDINEKTRKIFYDYKLSWQERMKNKIDNGEHLSEEEIKDLVFRAEEVFEEYGDIHRWDQEVITVIKLCNELYAVEWSEGLTEMQENSFYNQPYPAELKEEEITITRTVVIKKDKSNKN